MSEDIDALIKIVRDRLKRSERIRRNIPGDGRLRIDRPLPFLTAYRYPTNQGDLGTVELGTTEASYLFASAAEKYADELAQLCGAVKNETLDQFGAFLLIEIWCEQLNRDSEETLTHPAFRLQCRRDDVPESLMNQLAEAIGDIVVSRRVATVEIDEAVDSVVHPPGMHPLLPSIGEDERCHHVGVAIHPIFRDTEGVTLYPLVLQALRREFGLALRKSFFHFAAEHSDHPATQVHAVGPSTFVQAASLVDQQLCDVSLSFDYILQITPVNSDDAWEQFQSSGYSKPPVFYYRPLPRQPADLKQSLFEVPIDRVEDATLAQLFWEKQDELDRQITSLSDIDTPAFLYGNLQIYGEIESDLLELAELLLNDLHSDRKEPTDGGGVVTGSELMKMAQVEIGRYRELDSTFNASVELRDDIAAGIMVSKNKLLISRTAKVREERAQALMHHEIGTHVLTYFNGQGQPFQQLYAGLAGYESMQEGLAVMGELLTGGLTKSRLCMLAARVVAAQAMADGVDFPDTFSRLVEDWGFAHRVAFLIALRVYRGGGCMKDTIYLRGLRDVLQHLGDGNKVEPLFIGKFALGHLPAIEEFRQREVVKPPRLLPRYLHKDSARQMLADCAGKHILDLVGA